MTSSRSPKLHLGDRVVVQNRYGDVIYGSFVRYGYEDLSFCVLHEDGYPGIEFSYESDGVSADPGFYNRKDKAYDLLPIT